MRNIIRIQLNTEDKETIQSCLKNIKEQNAHTLYGILLEASKDKMITFEELE